MSKKRNNNHGIKLNKNIIRTLIIFFVILVFVFVHKTHKNKSNVENVVEDNIENNIENKTEPNDMLVSRFNTVKQKISNSELFSNDMIIEEEESVIDKYELEGFTDIHTIVVTDENDEKFQKVVIVFSQNREEYDAILTRLLAIYSSISNEYKPKYKDIFDKNSSVYIKQENGMSFLIISKDAESIYELIKEY